VTPFEVRALPFLLWNITVFVFLASLSLLKFESLEFARSLIWGIPFSFAGAASCYSERPDISTSVLSAIWLWTNYILWCISIGLCTLVSTLGLVLVLRPAPGISYDLNAYWSKYRVEVLILADLVVCTRRAPSSGMSLFCSLKSISNMFLFRGGMGGIIIGRFSYRDYSWPPTPSFACASPSSPV